MPFTFTVTSLNYDGSEFACFSVDPFVNELIIDGQNKGATNSGTVQLPRAQRTVRVVVDVDDDDAFLCFGDDDLDRFPIDVDLYTGANACRQGSNGSICFTATPTAAPSVCLGWKAQFEDAGPWSGIGSEDFLANKELLLVPASFARYRFKMENSSGVLFDRGGVLDKDGCIPGPKLPIREHWQLGTDLRITARLISQHCLDPAGTDCPVTGSPPVHTGANVMVREGAATGPAEHCAAFAEDPAKLPPFPCFGFPVDWTGLPPGDGLLAIFRENDAITRASAVISHLLKREEDTNGGLGVKTALIDHHLVATDGEVEVEVNEFCEFADPCTGDKRLTSCGGGHVLTLEPDGMLASASRFKNVIAHEFGHMIQANAMGLLNFNLGCGAGEPGQPPLCRCDHVPFDQQTHCLQSLEEPNTAQNEGYGYFYAAKSFNADLEPNCTLTYGKPVANTECMPGAASCAQDATTGLFVSQPPVPVDCRQTLLWRNSHCVDLQSSPDVLAFGVEWDWVEFFYAINNQQSAPERWSIVNVFDAYRSACGGTPASCSEKNVSWAGGANHASLVAGVQSLADNGLVPQAAAVAFRQRGNDFGVSNLP